MNYLLSSLIVCAVFLAGYVAGYGGRTQRARRFVQSQIDTLINAIEITRRRVEAFEPRERAVGLATLMLLRRHLEDSQKEAP